MSLHRFPVQIADPMEPVKVRASDQTILAICGLSLGLAFALAGCSPGSMIDQFPSNVGGLPAGTPARPVTPYDYPAVHDLPPPWQTEPMSAEDQDRLEQELTAVRNRQEGRPLGQKAVPADKK